jgi:hypothetical protein
MLRQILVKTIETVATNKPRALSPMAAFELLVTIENFAQSALPNLPQSTESKLFTELTSVTGFVPMYAFQAVTQHFRSGTQLAGN